MASPSPPPYDDIETFGKEYVNEHYINKIKYILENFHDNIEDKRYYMNALEEEYNEILSNRNVRYEPWQKQDMFNELIEQAKKELEEENYKLEQNIYFLEEELLNVSKMINNYDAYDRVEQKMKEQFEEE